MCSSSNAAENMAKLRPIAVEAICRSISMLCVSKRPMTSSQPSHCPVTGSRNVVASHWKATYTVAVCLRQAAGQRKTASSQPAFTRNGQACILRRSPIYSGEHFSNPKSTMICLRLYVGCLPYAAQRSEVEQLFIDSHIPVSVTAAQFPF